MARVTLQAAVPRPYSPGRGYGIPGPVPWSAARGGTTRRTACQDELPATITTVPLGVNVAGAGGGVRRASAAPASAQVGRKRVRVLTSGSARPVQRMPAAWNPPMGPRRPRSRPGRWARSSRTDDGRACPVSVGLHPRTRWRGGRFPGLRRGWVGDRSEDQLDDVPDGGVLAAGSSFGVGERAELAGTVVPDGMDPDDVAVLR